MDNENEVVETPTSGEIAAPIDTPAPATDAPASGGDGWNMDASPLEAEPWWNDIPEPVRPRVKSGIEGKARSFQQDYSKKSMALAEQRKQMEAQAARERKAAMQIIHGEHDPVAEKEQELATARQQIQTLTDEITALRADLPNLTGRAKEEAKAELAESLAELATLKQEKEERSRLEAEAAKAEEEEATSAFLTRLEADAPEIAASEDAFTDLCTLMAAGRTYEKALKMVRAEYGPPAGPKPAAPDPSLDLMNTGPAFSITDELLHGEGESPLEVAQRQLARARS